MGAAAGEGRSRGSREDLHIPSRRRRRARQKNLRGKFGLAPGVWFHWWCESVVFGLSDLPYATDYALIGKNNILRGETGNLATMHQGPVAMLFMHIHSEAVAGS